MVPGATLRHPAACRLQYNFGNERVAIFCRPITGGRCIDRHRLAALNVPSSRLAGLLTWATIAAWLVAVLGAVYRVGDSRAFWLGVALFGGCYFVVAFSSAFPTAKDHMEIPLRLFRRAFWTASIPGDSNPRRATTDSTFDEKTQQTLVWPAWNNGFGVTVHCLANWLFALAGGMIGRLFHATAAVRRADE